MEPIQINWKREILIITLFGIVTVLAGMLLFGILTPCWVQPETPAERDDSEREGLLEEFKALSDIEKKQWIRKNWVLVIWERYITDPNVWTAEEIEHLKNLHGIDVNRK